MPILADTITSLAAVAAIKSKAVELGFDAVGVASTEPSAHREYLRAWLGDGRAGSMDWLADRFDERTDVGVYMPGARAAVCVAVNYYTELSPSNPGDGRVARYALGEDYHRWMKDRLYDLADWVRATWPGEKTKCGVDSVPVLEKELAVRAGIGWMGKHTCVISPRLGSWILLGEVLTTLALPADDAVVDRCGTCTRCIDACPTGAITPYRVDAARCISYLTIEHRGELPTELTPKMGEWLYGCDVCQDVCPFNRKPIVSDAVEVSPRLPGGGLPAAAVAAWTPDDYQIVVKGTAMQRVKLPVLQRNAATVAGNSKSRI